MTEARTMEQQVDERLGQVEIRQARLESSLENVVREVSKLSGFVGRLDEHLQTMSRPNWGNLISATTLAVAAMAAFGGMFIRPIQMQALYNSEKISALDDRVQRDIQNTTQTMEPKLSNLGVQTKTDVLNLQADLKILDARFNELEKANFNFVDWDRFAIPLITKIDGLEKLLTATREDLINKSTGHLDRSGNQNE